MSTEKHKVIVIGSGPGGSVTATLLAEQGMDVLLLEAGRHLSLEDTPAFTTSEMQNKYKNGGITLAFGKSKVTYVEGGSVGGGSEVNSGLYHRLPEYLLSQWERNFEFDVNRTFLEETYQQIEKDICISYMPKPPKASLKLKEGADKLGWDVKEIPRWHKYKNKEDIGVKQSMTETYIPRFLKANGTLKAQHRAKKILKKSNGFEVICSFRDSNGEMLERKYSSEFLFVACGAVSTPSLLQRSGIRRKIGDTLSLHPSFKYTALFDEQINKDGMGVPVHQVKEFSPKVSFGCSISSYPYIGLALNDSNRLHRAKEWKKMANYYCMISPEGIGSVRNLPFFKSPLVRFKMTERDYKNIRDGYRNLAKLLFEAGAKELFPSVQKSISIKNISDISQIDSLSKSALNLMTIHLFCTTPMSGNRNKGPVNADGELHDVKNLFVCDGSILCSSPSVNPQGTIMAFSMMNAHKFINKHKTNEF